MCFHTESASKLYMAYQPIDNMRNIFIYTLYIIPPHVIQILHSRKITTVLPAHQELFSSFSSVSNKCHTFRLSLQCLLLKYICILACSSHEFILVLLSKTVTNREKVPASFLIEFPYIRFLSCIFCIWFVD